MKLDFITLYVIILLNSASFAVVWAVISTTYQSMAAARFWLGGLVISCVSGVLLAGAAGSAPLTYVGLALVAGSFAVMWQGVRVFYDQPPMWRTTLIIVASTTAALIFLGDGQEAINIIAAVSQIVPVCLAIATLLRARPRYIGAYVAAAAACIIVMGQSAEAITNALRLLALVSTETYYSFAAWFLVCAIIGGSVWNLGFLLMVADRLQSELKLLATRDDLTGQPNRRELQARLIFCEKSVRRQGTSAVLMMIDLDKFKLINDRYGHAAGDEALIHITNIAKSALRDDDVLARIGGDEFCVLLPHTGLSAASEIATRLANAITASPLPWKGQQIGLSASVGLTEWTPASTHSLADSLQLADAALFGTKRGRRNGDMVDNKSIALAG